MALQICSLGSGSKGNTTLVLSEDSNFLIDCGLSVEHTKKHLKSAGLSFRNIDFILITHEHIDHIKSAYTLSEAYGIPLYMHASTYDGICKRVGTRIRNAATFSTFTGFQAKKLDIIPFSVGHDVFTVGYSIADSEEHILYATDLGEVNSRLFSLGERASTIMIEANYDCNMLKSGPYPPFLKDRISSARGHLSNDDSAGAIHKLLNMGTKNFILGHLSEENNTPALARDTVITLLENEGAVSNKDFFLTVASQYERTDIIGGKIK